jgi:hypothetical protein
MIFFVKTLFASTQHNTANVVISCIIRCIIRSHPQLMPDITSCYT